MFKKQFGWALKDPRTGEFCLPGFYSSLVLCQEDQEIRARYGHETKLVPVTKNWRGKVEEVYDCCFE